jgi:hypothetical protein
MLLLTARGVFAACLLLLYQSPSIRFDSGRSAFLLENWSDVSQLSPEKYFEIFTVSVDAPDVPPMLGRYGVEGGVLTFIPQFPVQPGVRYRAVARVPGMAPVSIVVDIPKPVVKPTTVVDRVYPTTNVLPENQLKFYIHFSAPMARGFAYHHIALLDDAGRKIDAPFLELNEELWDPEGRRLTLFFDPGRIKRGLLTQEELGIVLHEGRRYTLAIDKGWKDAEGNPMAADFRKNFVVGAADRKAIDIKAWKIQKPPAGRRTAITVLFPEPMDHALAGRELDVVDSSGTSMRGSISIGPGEKSWIFTPEQPWKKGNYEVRVGSVLADLAGNMIDRPFEIDLFEKVDQFLDRSVRSIFFKID